VAEVIQEHRAPATKKQARKRIRDAKSVTFMDYSEKIGLPVWRVDTGEPQADLDSFMRRGSLSPILDELRGNPRVYVIHNADDFLVERKSLDELKEAMGIGWWCTPMEGTSGISGTRKPGNHVLGLFGTPP